nr:phage portal protein [Bacillus licheniformis]
MKNESEAYSPSPWRVVRTNTDVYIYSAYSKAEKKRFPYSNGRVIAKVADYSAYSKEKNARLIACGSRTVDRSEAHACLFEAKTARSQRFS